MARRNKNPLGPSQRSGASAVRRRRPVIGRSVRVGAFVSSVALTPSAMAAAVCTWNPVTGNWGTASDWSCGIVPTGPAVDTANIGVSQTVTINSTQSIYTLNNAGTIDIDAFLLTLQGGGSTTNTGTINVGAGPIPNNAALQVGVGHNINNTGGTINISADSVLNQFGSSIAGGVINTTGTGKVVAFSSAANFLDAVTLNGTLDMASIGNSRERVVNGLTLNGQVSLNGNGNLSFDGDNTLAGTGAIVFGDTGAGNRIDLSGDGTTTFGAGITVRGQNGTIGREINIGGTQTLVNNGLISADTAGGTITIDESAVVNNNRLEARNGGTLVLASNVSNGAGGVILADNGTVRQSGVRITGGTISSANGGVLQVTSNAANFVQNTTVAGVMDMASIGNSRQRVTDTLTVDGTLNLNGNGILSFEHDSALAGTGTIVFGDTGAGNRIDLDGDGTTTFGAGITVRGQNGTIGDQINIGGTQVLLNQGTISADVSGGIISITESAVTNTGTLEARNGGTLVLNSAVTQTGAGSILADGGVVQQSGMRVTGGTVDSVGSGVLRVESTAANFLDAVTLNGTLDMATIGNSRERIVNGLTLNGQVSLNGNGNLSFDGDNTLAGTGAIVFGDTGAGNRIDLSGDGTTTFGAGITVRGQNGTIGDQINIAGTQTLVNNGSVISDGGGTISFAESALVNNGLLRAQTGALNVGVALSGSGTLQVDSTGSMALAAGVKTQGTLAMGAAGAALNLNTGHLTINTDYTNAGAGSGNAFNRRAGVSGTGLIVAGGDVAQVITGATVTNGATTNATLTINNVRVGATTYNYQVGNAGTTGPTLRGAIQTSVNGGNLTDPRLGGVGATAGNYNAGGPGGNSGDLGVTFTAASAGLLAPLTGQVLNLRSNFENIADQKLNIVLGAGAAAYNAAVGSANSPVVVANQRVGGSNTAAVTVANTAPAGSFSEDLNVTVGGATDAATGAGAITGRLAGTNNTGTGAIAVAVDTSTAGAKTGGVTLNYETAGAVGGVSNGLGTASVGSEVVAVSGNVYRLAQGQTTPVSTSFGNVHVGDSAVQNLTVSNTAVADGFSESLNMTLGAVTGNAYTTSGSGGVTQLAAGASTVPVTLGIDTSTAGAKSGSLTLNYASDGTGTSGLAAIAAGSQTVTVSGAVYRLASANTLGAVNFGNVHVGDTVQQALVITNTALADGFSESLNASFGASSDSRILTSGSISQLAAGATNASGMIVGLDTSAAGSVAGTQVIHFASDGTGTSGLGVTNLASQTIGVTGDITTSGSVFRLASASPAAPNPVNFGNLRIGTVADQALSITNTAIDDGFSEKLNASIASNGAPVTASGSFNLLGPTATDSSSLHVGLDTSTAGAKSGTATIALVSDGTGTSGLGLTNLPAQIVAVSGAVYRLASPQLDTPSVVLAARRGDASPTAGVGVTNVSPDAYTEGLNASIGTASAGFSASGAIGNLAAGGSDAATLRVGLDTSTAGATSGSASVDFVSTGAGTTGAADLSVGSAIVGLVGRVYETAVASLTTSSVDFGIVHVGDVVTDRTVGVANAAPVAALNDTLKASIATGAAGFGASGSVSGLAAGANDTSSLLVALDTTSAGFYSGSANVAFASSNPDMADLSLGSQSVALAAQVNNYADAALRQAGGFGVLSAVGDVYTLDFGTLVQGSAVRSASLEVLNDVLGPSDLLDGQFGATDTDDFAYLASFFDLFTDLGAGQAQGGFGISFDPVTLGLVSDSVVLNASGHNASGFRGALGPITLHFTARVVAGGTGTVPVPGTLLLLASALVLMASLRRRVTLR